MLLVTGGAGFIGSNIVAALNAQGRMDIAICDWLGTDQKWRNLQKSSFSEFVHPGQVLEWLDSRDDVDGIIHMGAISATTAVDGDEVISNNFVLSVRLLDHCAKRNIPLLYASSAAVYGDGELSFVDDTDLDSIQKLRPLNLYGWSKRQFDLVVAERLRSRKHVPVRCVGFRFFNVFGPNEYHKGEMKSVIAKIHPPVSSGQTISLFKSHREGIADGDQRRDFVYVKDAVSVVLWALGPNGKSGIFNVGTGQAESFRTLAESVFDACNLAPAIEYRDMPIEIRDRYQYFTQASLENLRAAGYDAPFTPLRRAIAEYVGQYLASPDPYR